MTLDSIPLRLSTAQNKMTPNTKKGAISRVVALALLAASLTTAVPVAEAQAAEYDYVVVGTGPGGGPLAVNLAKAGYSVFLMEAGDASVATGFGQYPPSITWDFFVNHYPEDDARNNQYSHLTWKTPEGRYWVGRTGAPAGSKLLGVYYPRGKPTSTATNGVVMPEDRIGLMLTMQRGNSGRLQHD